MTNVTERQLARILEQINETIDSRLPPEGIKQSNFAMWQFWLAIATVIFFAGTITIQIQNNAATLEKHTIWDKEKTAELQANIDDNHTGLVSHMQWELEHELQLKNEEIKALQEREK